MVPKCCTNVSGLPLTYSLCCSYLAFKVEEYNVSVDQFVHVLAPQLREPATEFVLSHEVRCVHVYSWRSVSDACLSRSWFHSAAATVEEAPVSLDSTLTFSTSGRVHH